MSSSSYKNCDKKYFNNDQDKSNHIFEMENSCAHEQWEDYQLHDEKGWVPSFEECLSFEKIFVTKNIHCFNAADKADNKPDQKDRNRMESHFNFTFTIYVKSDAMDEPW